MIRVVFVCTANICRSPMAEGLLKHHWKNRENGRGQTELKVSSMGIQMIDRQPASENAVAVCAENGVDISAHRSQALHPEELRQADLILTMEPFQQKHLQLLAPTIKDKVFLLTRWQGKKLSRKAVADPIGRSMQRYRKTFKIIDQHVQRIISHLAQWD
jgi:protein-tyrosine-phosphatase